MANVEQRKLYYKLCKLLMSCAADCGTIFPLIYGVTMHNIMSVVSGTISERVTDMWGNEVTSEY